MKTLFISLVCVWFVSSCFARERCTPGHSYNEDCNACTCIDSGRYACTQRTCYNGPQFPDTPTPARQKRELIEPGCDKGESYYDGCNQCSCVDNKFYACTERACFQGPIFADTVTEASRSRREVQESTGKYDPPKPNQLPFLRFDVERCTPHEVKNQECNRCKCTKNGKGWLCTRKACPKFTNDN